MERGKPDVVVMDQAVNEPVITEMYENFGWVIPAINEILEGNPQLTFTAADVYAACSKGAATLWTTQEGFVVTTGELDTFTGERTMLIWLAWARKRGTNLVEKYQDFFVNQARVGGFTKLETRSSVPELREYFLGNGWQIDTIVYTRDV